MITGPCLLTAHSPLPLPPSPALSRAQHAVAMNCDYSLELRGVERRREEMWREGGREGGAVPTRQEGGRNLCDNRPVFY